MTTARACDIQVARAPRKTSVTYDTCNTVSASARPLEAHRAACSPVANPAVSPDTGSRRGCRTWEFGTGEHGV